MGILPDARPEELKFMRPRDVRIVLKSLPKNLDETYERILVNIDQRYHQEAFAALRWLAFSERPLRIEEIAEACIVDPENELVDHENRFPPRGIFEILSILITESPKAREEYGRPLDDQEVVEIRLAHFSVKEYLVSDRIRHGPASGYGFQEASAQSFIAKSCLSYIFYYSASDNKTLSLEDLAQFPLLEYACSRWDAHSRASSIEDRESIDDLIFELLASNTRSLNWLRVYIPDMKWRRPFRNLDGIGSPLYYACYIGLSKVVKLLLDEG